MKVAQRDKSTLAKFFVCALLSVSLMAVTSIPLLAGAPVDFEQDIRPLLAAPVWSVPRRGDQVKRFLSRYT